MAGGGNGACFHPRPAKQMARRSWEPGRSLAGGSVSRRARTGRHGRPRRLTRAWCRAACATGARRPDGFWIFRVGKFLVGGRPRFFSLTACVAVVFCSRTGLFQVPSSCLALGLNRLGLVLVVASGPRRNFPRRMCTRLKEDCSLHCYVFSVLIHLRLCCCRTGSLALRGLPHERLTLLTWWVGGLGRAPQTRCGYY